MAVEVVREGAVAVVTVNRPEALNSLDAETNEALLAAARELSADESVRAVLLHRRGRQVLRRRGGHRRDERADSRAGAPLGALWSGRDERDRGGAGAVGRRRQRLRPRRRLRAGAGLRRQDRSENAKFGQPEINLGITPGFGGTQRLPRLVGEGWAKYLILTGRDIRAEEALRIGLVQAVFPKDELMTHAMKLAEELAGKSPLAMRYCKAAVHAAAEHGPRHRGRASSATCSPSRSRATTSRRAWRRSSRSGRRSSRATEAGRLLRSADGAPRGPGRPGLSGSAADGGQQPREGFEHPRRRAHQHVGALEYGPRRLLRHRGQGAGAAPRVLLAPLVHGVEAGRVGEVVAAEQRRQVVAGGEQAPRRGPLAERQRRPDFEDEMAGGDRQPALAGRLHDALQQFVPRRGRGLDASR